MVNKQKAATPGLQGIGIPIDYEAPASMVYQNKLTAFLIMIASGIVYNLAAHLNIAGKHVLMQPIPAQATVIVYIPAFQNHA